MKRKATSSASAILRRRYGLKRKPKPEVIGGRGWVPVTVGGVVYWPHARRARFEVMRAVTSIYGGDTWRDLYRNGWRIVRCRAEDRPDRAGVATQGATAGPVRGRVYQTSARVGFGLGGRHDGA